MRQIKFRAWDGQTMHYDGIFQFTQFPFEGIESGEMICRESQTDQSVLMQWTGLFDKNNEPIYEGDIIKWDDESNGKYWRVAVVEIDPSIQFRIVENTLHELSTRAGYIYQISNFIYRDTHNHLTVVGNIHQSSDLLSPYTTP